MRYGAPRLLQRVLRLNDHNKPFAAATTTTTLTTTCRSIVQCDNNNNKNNGSPLRHHDHVVVARRPYPAQQQQQQRWSSSAASKSKPAVDEELSLQVPTSQPSESSTTLAANHPPTLPVRQWSTPLAKTIAQAIEVCPVHSPDAYFHIQHTRSSRCVLHICPYKHPTPSSTPLLLE